MAGFIFGGLVVSKSAKFKNPPNAFCGIYANFCLPIFPAMGTHVAIINGVVVVQEMGLTVTPSPAQFGAWQPELFLNPARKQLFPMHG